MGVCERAVRRCTSRAARYADAHADAYGSQREWGGMSSSCPRQTLFISFSSYLTHTILFRLTSRRHTTRRFSSSASLSVGHSSIVVTYVANSSLSPRRRASKRAMKAPSPLPFIARRWNRWISDARRHARHVLRKARKSA